MTLSSLRRIVSGLVCASAVAWVGCVANATRHSPSILPEIDIVQLKDTTDLSIRLSKQAKLDIEVISTKLTEMDNKLTLLSEQVSEVSIAKVEEIETRMALLVEAYKDLEKQLAAVKATIDSRPAVAKPAASPPGPLSQPPVRPGATFSPSAGAGIITASAEYESYQNALRLFSGRKYDQALTQFSEVLTTYPGGTYADNSQYWIGECYYAIGEYANALTAFKKVPGYANSSKADDAQLKIGLCNLKLSQYHQARIDLQELIDRYPASEYVPRAKNYLSEIK